MSRFDNSYTISVYCNGEMHQSIFNCNDPINADVYAKAWLYDNDYTQVTWILFNCDKKFMCGEFKSKKPLTLESLKRLETTNQ